MERLACLRFGSRELGAERDELILGDPDDVDEELLLANRSLVGAGVDAATEVLAERPDTGEGALGDQAT